jgi:hypothetical protein
MTVAHILSASLIALTFANIAPDETPYLVAALLAASILDLDLVFDAIRARTAFRAPDRRGLAPLHGLLGLLGAGVLAGLLFLADQTLARVVFVAFAAHLALDWVMEVSTPLTPVDATEIRYFVWTTRQRVLVNAAIGALFGALWILYLAAVL